jgi:hypothetical protein
MARYWIVPALVVLLALLGDPAGVTPAGAGSFEVFFNDSTGRDGGYDGNHDPCPDDCADSYHNVDEGKLEVRSNGGVLFPGEYWANAYIYVDFIYVHTHNHMCRFEFRYHLNGAMWAEGGTSHFWLKAELIDRAWDTTIATFWLEDTYFSGVSIPWTPNHWRVRAYEHTLQAGRSYRLRLWANTTTTGSGGGLLTANADFYSGDKHVDWDYVRISYEEPSIPTLSEWGLIILTLTIVAVATVALVQRRRMHMAG